MSNVHNYAITPRHSAANLNRLKGEEGAMDRKHQEKSNGRSKNTDEDHNL